MLFPGVRPMPTEPAAAAVDDAPAAMAPSALTTDAAARAEFRSFFDGAEPRLRSAFVAAYDAERGREATAEALAYAWENWERVRVMENAVGYLYRVGQSRTRPRRRRRPEPAAPARE